ncbi:hypothetical protein ACFUIZ_33125 [Streptomyces cinereoruber]|uniref:hypothetical protein n=1 Tax=Streptomyces cinereoruber TaxID=67260 RepID=UPI003633C074
MAPTSSVELVGVVSHGDEDQFPDSGKSCMRDVNGFENEVRSLTRTRLSPLTDAESGEFVDIQLQLREAIHGRGPEWQERLARIEQNAIPLLKPADIQRLAPPARPSAAAARSRSATTVRKPNPPKHSPT